MATLILWLKRFVFIVASIVVGFEVYDRLIRALIDDRGTRIVPFVALWALTAYFVLPRIHRFLTKIYIPDYFIGRVRTADGMLGDPVNIAVTGTKAQLIRAMKADGWHIADQITLKTSWRMVTSTIMKRSYPTAPVSNLFLFGKQQDVAFQKEVNGNPHARHHVRFWKVPTGWYLPGGYKVNWVGAATYDRSVGFSLFTGQITHKIAENTDEERDYVARSLSKNGKQETINHFSTAYHARNGGGDNIKTDGILELVHL
jgi:hypothetical protein